MKLNRISWTIFFLLSLVSLAFWLKFSYPQLSIANHTIDRSQAIEIAEDYLRETGYTDWPAFQTAAIIENDGGTNRYLQKTIGFKGLRSFIKEHDFDLFFWKVRFFSEGIKDQYLFSINSATGEITGFSHIIDENAARRKIERDEGRVKAQKFLADRFGFNPEGYTPRANFATIRDNRSDFRFSWQNNNVSIPWSKEPNRGTGKLVIRAEVSGDEIISFSKNTFLVPDQFKRYLETRRDLGLNIMAAIQIIILILIGVGVFIIITRQNHLAMHATKKFYISVMVLSFLLSILTVLNQYQLILFDYKTTVPFNAYLWRQGINTVMSALFIAVVILIPSLAGELLHFEAAPKQQGGSFLQFIRTTFASRNVAGQIVLGYFVCIITLGIQSVLVKIGQTHFGVWIEHDLLNHSSTAYLPFVAAFTFGFKASISEEIMYRLYAINLGKMIFNKIRPNGRTGNVLIVVLISSLIWGFAHSNHFVFPAWFRGVEVTCLGLFLSFIYLRFGFIPVLVGHYLIDVFWNSAGYLFGDSKPFHFYSSLFVLLIPLMLGAVAFILNRKEEAKPLRWSLNRHQLYNLEVLKTYLRENKSDYQNKSQKQIKEEITSHGWDPAVVDIAIEDFNK